MFATSLRKIASLDDLPPYQLQFRRAKVGVVAQRIDSHDFPLGILEKLPRGTARRGCQLSAKRVQAGGDLHRGVGGHRPGKGANI